MSFDSFSCVDSSCLIQLLALLGFILRTKIDIIIENFMESVRVIDHVKLVLALVSIIFIIQNL